jgi:uncharacterized membrane protein
MQLQMFDFLSIAGSCCTLAIGAAFLVLPIIAMVMIVQLRQRLFDLEREVKALRQREPEPIAEAPIQAILVEPEPSAPTQEKPKPKKHRPAKPVSTADWSKWEVWLGVRVLGWAAVVLLVFAGGYFLKLVFDRGLIGELGRVGIGIAIGTLLCVAGYVMHWRGQWLFNQMLTAAGVALLYLSVFATFGYYRLLDQDHAGPYLVAVVAETFALAILYRAPAIAIMAIVGGLLAPVLLRSDRDQYVALFSYLFVLNVGVIATALFRRWWVVTSLALLGTHGLFWTWYFESYHPTKLDACLVFHGALFGLYLLPMLVVNVARKIAASIEDLLRLVVQAVLVSSVGYVLLDDRYHDWIGTFAVGMAIVYSLLAVVVNHFRAGDEPLLFVLLSVSMAFVAAVFPLQTNAAWISVGWAAQGLALWWFGLRVRSHFLYGLGAAFLLLALGRLIFYDTFSSAFDKTPLHDGPFIPIFNNYGLPAVAVTCSVILAALLQRRTRPEFLSVDFLVMRLLGMVGVVALWIILSLECYDFFIQRGNLYSPGVQARLTQAERELPRQVLEQRYAEYAEALRLTAQMSLSALWAVFALVMLACGLRMKHRPLRWMALGLFALTLGKVMLVDTERLHGFYRVGALVALSLMMAAGAWAYQKLRAMLATEDASLEENNDTSD